MALSRAVWGPGLYHIRRQRTPGANDCVSQAPTAGRAARLFSLARSAFHLKRWTLLYPTLSAIIQEVVSSILPPVLRPLDAPPTPILRRCACNPYVQYSIL